MLYASLLPRKDATCAAERSIKFLLDESQTVSRLIEKPIPRANRALVCSYPDKNSGMSISIALDPGTWRDLRESVAGETAAGPDEM